MWKHYVVAAFNQEKALVGAFSRDCENRWIVCSNSNDGAHVNHCRSGEADVRGEVEGGEQAVLRGAGELAAQPVGGGAGPLPVLPLRGHLQHDADGPGPVLGLVPGALVRAGGQQNILPAKA